MKKTKLRTAEDKIKEFLSLSTLSGRQNRDAETALIEFGKLCAKRALEEAKSVSDLIIIDDILNQIEIK